jgi:peptidoglycan/LPS O-acetylase OafA/YrhL
VISAATSFLAFEAIVFGAASLVHADMLVDGYEHARAATSEGVIAVVLLAGLGACLLRPPSARKIALAVQTFALLGTLVGGFTIVVGIGPQTMADHIFHLLLVVVLLAGLVVVFKGPKEIGREQPLADRPTA